MKSITLLARKLAKVIIKFQPSKDISDQDLEYLLWICSLYIRIRNLPGHIAEVGVADGRNAVLFGRLIKQYNDQSVRQYIGFDTFDGYSQRDLLKDGNLYSEAWKNNSKKGVLERCEINNVEDVIEIFEGDALQTVPQVLKNHRGNKFQKGKGLFALVYIDCNACIPAMESMKNFFDYIVPGGLIVIDEKLQGGESEAILEFAKLNCYKVQRLGGNEVPMAIIINEKDLIEN